MVHRDSGLDRHRSFGRGGDCAGGDRVGGSRQLGRRGRDVHLLVHLVKLALDHTPNFIGLPPKLAEELAQTARKLGQALGSEDQQRDDCNQNEFARADIEHRSEL